MPHGWTRTFPRWIRSSADSHIIAMGTTPLIERMTEWIRHRTWNHQLWKDVGSIPGMRKRLQSGVEMQPWVCF
ncbi:hypothetical protein Y032_0103g3581 [Ancylostoma ceylanicum]|uniref:Uncharacterized protein n=1 Tax=Ancylostoma ceylanicum TaxID=53326 RepID=A0A016THA5_9BILA|nr:hypothetical protein Y032_0103g3581 [Ancylostoma ceylanicum]